MMRGNRRDAPRLGDQPDWDACIAWRRMLTAVVNLGWDITIVLLPMRDSLRARLQRIECPRHRDDVAFYLEEMDDYVNEAGGPHPYGMCYQLLEALACFHEITGPDRIEAVGVLLCAQFRAVYPVAPAGFERIGRMRQGREDEGPGGRVERSRGEAGDQAGDQTSDPAGQDEGESRLLREHGSEDRTDT